MADENKDGEQLSPHYEGRIPILPGEAERAESARRAEKKEEHEYKNRQTSIQRGIFITQAALVFFGVIGMSISIYQAQTAVRSAEQAKRSADLAEDAYEINNGNFDRMMERTIDQTAAQMQSAQAADNSVKATQDQMQLDQRAWIGVEGVDGSLEAGKPFIINTHYFNTGRTPALHLVEQARGIVLPRGEKFTPDYNAPRDESLPVKAVAAIFPNQVSTQHVRMTKDNSDPTKDAPADQSGIDVIDRGDVTIYVFGRVCYRDVFNKPHWMRFCNLYNHKDNSYYACDTYNEVDSGKNGTEEDCNLGKR